jgi:transglutaminase-like putative cysteine protease
MSLDQAHRIVSILLASTSFVGLMLSARLPEWLTLLTGSALILVFLRAVEFKAIGLVAAKISLSTTSWNILVVMGFFGFWIDSLWISRELLPAGIHFLLVLLVIKLFNLQLRRDYLHLYAISLVAILAAASLTSDLWYLPIFLTYLLCGVWTLLLFQLTKKPEEIAASAGAVLQMEEPSESSCRVSPHLFWLANGITAATVGITLIIFFAIPRVGGGFYQKGYGENIRTSGFSNTVDLGAIGPVKRDPSVVMRVEIPDRAGHEVGRFYLRGVAFDRYDGRSWANELSHRRAMGESDPGTFILRRSQSPGTSYHGHTVRQNILLESLDTPVLFAAPFAETVSGQFGTVQSDLTGALYLPFPSPTRIEYSVVSRSNPVLPADLQPQPISYPDSFIRYFLQAPMQSERIDALAREIVQAKHTAYEKALAIQEHLTRNYRYSLDAPLADQAYPLEEFLFNRKTGYCEHYATAMAIMLRTIGIPARLVTGFLATEWNEYGNYYVVRQQDAHAWVEVHLPHSGWVLMDPTPATTEDPGPTSPVWQTVGRILDNFRLRWNRLVVQYSTADQLAVVRELKTGSTTARNLAWDSLSALVTSAMAVFGKSAEYFNRDNVLLIAASLGLALIGLGALLWLRFTRPWQRKLFLKADRQEEPAISHLYRQMIRHLGKRGIVRPAAMAPLELIRLTQEQWKDAGSAVGTITALYCRGRFGQMPLTREEFRSAQDSLRHLMALHRL